MDASDGSREEKDDDHQSNRKKLNFDRLGCKNVEGSDKKCSDEVPHSSDQMEVVEDATGGRGRMYGNNDRVVENSNAEFIASQMDIRGSVGVVGGQFGNELVQSSDDSDVWNQRKRPQGQNTGNTGSSSHGTALDHGNLLVQSTSGTQLVLHSESSNVLGQGHGQGTSGTGSVLHSESSSRNVHGQGQQDHGNLLGQSTSGTQFVLHSESSNVLGQGQGTDGTASVLHSGSSNGHGQGQQGMYSKTVTPAATQYQRGRFTVTHEQPSAISGVQEHNLRVRSDPNMVRANMFRQWTPQVSQQIVFFGTPINPFFPTFASQNAGLPVAWPPVQSGTGFFMPQRVQEHNMRVPLDANMVSADMFRQGTPQMSQQIVFFGTPINPFFPTFASQNAGLPVAWPPVQSGTGFFMPQRVQEHNMRVPLDANMVSADMFRQGTPQMSQQIGCFGTPMNPFFPTFASQNAGLPVARPRVHMGMSSNADMAVEARDREEVVSDQGSTSEDS
uniref:Uncharacterized protein n=1 Tax=Tanacetum cinerariifolium TaxID=118510 RepID=A0A6L2N1Y4_TANCI|nr:hypothetical protein [Tanacetum cinerariifolium]